ncbi:MAG: S8 family serine peptidase, partial [Chloroflexota bacterium]|nr:S8 family serine peptidase [Chloroflexota bacterium]
PYGLDYTHAPDVWALGFSGQGIVVASQDTGVEWDHPALRARYRGVITPTLGMTATVDHVYNWFDAWGLTGRPPRCFADAQIPCDDDGHGTHTVGTMVGDASADGDTVLGMAPNAQWIGCRNMNRGVGTPASYTACFEFLLAPYPQGGNSMTEGRPELGPDIINNSWGCPPSEGCDVDTLRQVVETVRAAGQMVVASAGNKGPNCNTVVDPIAIYDAAFSVGAHDSAGRVAGFSSRGAVTIDSSGRLKPDISAPGVQVRSTWVEGAYNTISGTSMAGPHVAGAIALLWSAVPTLTGQLDLTEQVLLKSATPTPAQQCEGSQPVTPNNTYGYGRLNVLAAVQLAQNPGSLALRVVDLDGEPVPNAPVVLTDRLTRYQVQANTGVDGLLQLSQVYSGTYAATVSLSGSTFETIEIALTAAESRQVEVREVAPTAEPDNSEPLRPSLFLPLVSND